MKIDSARLKHDYFETVRNYVADSKTGGGRDFLADLREEAVGFAEQVGNFLRHHGILSEKQVDGARVRVIRAFDKAQTE